MTRVTLVHWNAEEADERADVLCQAGYDVSCHTDARAQPKALREAPPDAFVIDLHRVPSQGRELGGWLRRQPPTRAVPIVFIEGDADKTARVRALLPDAAYASWDNVVDTLAAAIAAPPEAPRVPGGMDAYQGVPLPERLGIRAGESVALCNAPADVEAPIRPLPDGVSLTRCAGKPCRVVLWFETSIAGLEQGLSDAVSQLAEGGRLWILWPKKASGRDSDLSQAVVRAFGLQRGLVDYKIVSFDATWSGLCFARRTPATGR